MPENSFSGRAPPGPAREDASPDPIRKEEAATRPIVGAKPPLFLQVHATDDKLAPAALDIVTVPASQTFDESVSGLQPANYLTLVTGPEEFCLGDLQDTRSNVE